MEQCRAVFFDFDGTLVDSNAIKREAFFEVTSGFFGDQEYLTHLLDSNTELTRYQIFKKFTQRCASKNTAPSLAKALVASYSELVYRKISEAPEIEGASEFVTALKEAGILVFVCSATPELELRRVLDGRKWTSLFSAIRGAPKTKRMNVEELQLENYLRPENCYFVGDQESDRAVAKATCRRFFWVTDSDCPPCRESEIPVTDLRVANRIFFDTAGK